jgi:amino-acid N-acetyltransferase
MLIRKPTVHDVPKLTALINRDSTILPRSQHYVFMNLRDFIVAEEDGELVGCGSLHVLWENIAEIRAVTMIEDDRRNGWFRQLVDCLLEDGRRLGVQEIVVLTQDPKSFVNIGFKQVERTDVPQIVWKECINCVHFPDCREKPVLFNMGSTKQGESS